MKKLLAIAALTLATYFSYGQTLKTRSLLGLHVITVQPKPNVTMDRLLVKTLV